MAEDALYATALMALALAIEDAVSYPNVQYAAEVRKLGTHCLSELKGDSRRARSDVDSIRAIMVLNRMIIRTISQAPFSVVERDQDLRSLNGALSTASLVEADKAAILEISSHFSDVAREYCVSQSLPLDFRSVNPRLAELVALCNENAELLVRRSVVKALQDSSRTE